MKKKLKNVVILISLSIIRRRRSLYMAQLIGVGLDTDVSLNYHLQKQRPPVVVRACAREFSKISAGMSLRRVSSSIPQVLGFASRSFKSLNLTGVPLDSSSSPCLTHGIHLFQCPVDLDILLSCSEISIPF